MTIANHFHLYDNPELLADAAANFIALKIKECLEKQPRCRIALPGGSTPARCLKNLSELELPWSQIDWYVGDERCLPVGAEERNDSMINQMLFSQTSVSEKNFFPIKAELGAEKAAEDYALSICAFNKFDIAILGMGEDGHTASLFPDNKALNDQRTVVPVFDAPKPPSDRVSLSLSTFAAATIRIVLIAGKDKKLALDKVKAGEPLPVNSIGHNEWFVDGAANG